MIIGLLVGLIMAFISWLVVLNGLVHEAIFRKLGSKRTFLAWIPIASYYELAVLTRDENNKNKCFSLEFDNSKFKFWFVAMSIASAIPFVGAILGIIIQIGCLGNCYARAFAILENKPLKEVSTTGYFCGAIPIIVMFKYKHLIESDSESMYKTTKYDIAPQPVQQYNPYAQQMPAQGYNQYGQQGYNQQMQQVYNQQPQQHGYNQYGQGVVPPQQNMQNGQQMQQNIQFNQPMQQNNELADEFNMTEDMF